MFFGSWQGIFRLVVVGLAAYAALVVLVRVAGSRSLAKLNAFDLVVTIALGSTLSSVLLDKAIPLLEGVTAFAVLLGLQFAVAWASARSERFAKLTRSAPVIVYRHGRFLQDAMKETRLTESDVHAVIRRAQLGSPEAVEAVVLETSGDLSVIERTDKDAASAREPALVAEL